MSFDIPYPADYGGIIDVFSRIKSLHKAGVHITLHCFEYGRKRQPELEKYCESVYYYPRKKIFSFSNPYIVVSRKNKLLRKRLMDSDCPILLEGIQCAYYSGNGDLKGKNVWVRLHNVEYDYYFRLYKSSFWSLKKIYYAFESRLLYRFERNIAPLNRFISISKADLSMYQSIDAKEVHFLPPFLDSVEIKSCPGKGNYCLYHGNLSVIENEKAVRFLIEEIFTGLNTRLIVSGKNPSKHLKNLCRKKEVDLVENPAYAQMESLIQNAQINVLPSLNSTGTKLKILHALLQGRFVVTNDNAVQEEQWASLCVIANNKMEYIQTIKKLMQQSFTKEMIDERQKFMNEYFDPAKNTEKLINLLFK